MSANADPHYQKLCSRVARFRAIAGFSQTGVQWNGLDLEDPPS